MHVRLFRFRLLLFSTITPVVSTRCRPLSRRYRSGVASGFSLSARTPVQPGVRTGPRNGGRTTGKVPVEGRRGQVGGPPARGGRLPSPRTGRGSGPNLHAARMPIPGRLTDPARPWSGPVRSPGTAARSPEAIGPPEARAPAPVRLRCPTPRRSHRPVPPSAPVAAPPLVPPPGTERIAWSWALRRIIARDVDAHRHGESG
jgi:hypothetical protein